MESINFNQSDHSRELNVSASHDKYSHENIVNPAKIKKAQSRWNQCIQKFRGINEHAFDGPVLDFGCGVGYFVYEGLQRGIDIFGVDRAIGKIKRYQYLLKQNKSPEKWAQNCLIADGTVLPFPSNSFSAVTSWWVFEHIANTREAIDEIVRITKPEGIIVIRAQDARTGWEGHCKIPWIPYLSGKLANAWIDEFEGSPDERENVYDITQPQIVSLLEEKGCRIVCKDRTPPPIPLSNFTLKNCTEEQIRKLARIKKVEYESGIWRPKPDGLYLYAQKSI